MPTFLRSAFLCAALLATGLTLAATPQVYMIGDSTMADKPLDLPERGWGMTFAQEFLDPATVHNHAVNGRSTKSFIDEGRWAKVVSELKPGDYVIIQFGHNDEKKEDPARYTDPATTYRDNLRRFIREAREKGASPILATPVCRRKFDAAGKLQNTHDGYPDAVRAVAKEERVPYLDLELDTARWLQAVGDERSKQFFMWIPAGEYPKLPQGRKDDTHFVEAGARHVADLAVAEIRYLGLPLVALLKQP